MRLAKPVCPEHDSSHTCHSPKTTAHGAFMALRLSSVDESVVGRELWSSGVWYKLLTPSHVSGSGVHSSSVLIIHIPLTLENYTGTKKTLLQKAGLFSARIFAFLVKFRGLPKKVL